MDMMGGGMMGIWFLMMLFGLLAFIGIILLAVWAVTRLSGSERLRAGSPSASAEDPLVILQRRYARGEIGGTTTSVFAQTSKARDKLKGSRLVLVAGLAALIVGVAGCSAPIA